MVASKFQILMGMLLMSLMGLAACKNPSSGEIDGTSTGNPLIVDQPSGQNPSPGPSPGPGPGPGNPIIRDAVFGKWQGDCRPWADSVRNFQSQRIIEDIQPTVLHVTIQFFEDTECIDGAMATDYFISITTSQRSVTEAGMTDAQNLDYVALQSHTETALNKRMVDYFNQNRYADHADWTIGIPREIAPSSIMPFYGLFVVINHVLYSSGVNSANSCATPEKRCVDLLMDYPRYPMR